MFQKGTYYREYIVRTDITTRDGGGGSTVLTGGNGHALLCFVVVYCVLLPHFPLNYRQISATNICTDKSRGGGIEIYNKRAWFVSAFTQF